MVRYQFSVKLSRFWFQLEASRSSVLSHTEVLWYNKTVCLWMTIYIYIYIHTHTDFYLYFMMKIKMLIIILCFFLNRIIMNCWYSGNPLGYYIYIYIYIYIYTHRFLSLLHDKNTLKINKKYDSGEELENKFWFHFMIFKWEQQLEFKSRFCLVSFVQWSINFCGLFNAEVILVEQ